MCCVLWWGKVHCSHKMEQISRRREQVRISIVRTGEGMDGPHLHFTVRTIFFSFLLLISPQFCAQQREYLRLLMCFI